MRDVSVVIPTHEDGEHLRRCLESVRRSEKVRPKIVVVDQTPKGLRDLRGARLVRLTENRGVAGGRNAGIGEGGVPAAVCFLDHDIELAPETLARLADFLARHSKVGVVTPAIYYRRAPGKLWAVGFFVDLLTGIPQANVETAEPREVDVAPSVIFARGEVLRAIGGFDERFFAVFEDADFCFRVRKAGFGVFAVPAAQAWHDLPPDPSEALPRLLGRTFLIARNRLCFLKTYSPSWPLPLLFHLALSFRYAYLGLRFGKPDAFLTFLEGTIAGLQRTPPKIPRIG